MTQSKIQNRYLDANNLYGHAMCKFLPASGFKWIDHIEFDFSDYTSKSSKGCILEVDVQYLKELEEVHD